MHLEAGYENPLLDWELGIVKRGIQRLRGSPPKQKLPITLHILSKVYAVLDKNNPKHTAFWAACLTAFYGFLRKSTLLPKSHRKSPNSSLCVKDVSVQGNVVLLTVRHSKTIQFGQRVVTIPLAAVPGSPLCPVTAVCDMLQLNAGLAPT
jgi:hypothetical protein